MKHVLTLSALAAVLAAGEAGAQGAREERTIELYEAPVFSGEPAVPRYPSAAATLGQEGWVKLSFMVDAEGEAYEIMVTDHVGNDAFIDAARRALEETAFRPARIGNELVDGSKRMLYRFVLEEDGMNAARRSFAGRYRRFISTLRNNESRAETDRELARLEGMDIHNNYEYAYLSLARYFYALSYGTELERMQHLEQALGESLSSPEYESYLGDDATMFRRTLLQLQVLNGYLGEAMDTFELMHLKDDEEGIALFRELSEQLISVRNNDDSYGVAGRIGDDGSWNIVLFKDSFYIDGLTGAIEELKLRCQRSYVFFEFDPTRQYNVSDRAGDCSLEIIGDAGTTFTLVQL